MKKLALPILFILFSASTFAQGSVVQVNTEISGNDTLRTFFLDSYLADYFVDKLTTTYGAPEGAGTGLMKFSGVTIPGIGSGLLVDINDGAMIFDGTNWYHSTFLNAADKDAKLSADPARMRRMYITVKVGNSNCVNTLQEETAMISFTEGLVL